MRYFCPQIYAVRCGLTKCPITSQTKHRGQYKIDMGWVRGAHGSAKVGTGQETHSWELELTQVSCRTRDEGEGNLWLISGLLMMHQAVTGKLLDKWP